MSIMQVRYVLRLNNYYKSNRFTAELAIIALLLHNVRYI